MANKQDRRSFIEKVIGRAATLIGMILAVRLDQRQAEKHGWEQADRRQDVEIQGTSHAHSASRAAMSVTRETIPI